MSRELLDGSTARRLIYSQGQWTLELEKLVAVDRSVFRPKTHRLKGAATIVEYLRVNAPESRLLSRALELISRSLPGADGLFEARDGDWVAVQQQVASLPPSRADSASLRAQALEIVELRTELVRVRGSHERLKLRVGDLQRQLAMLTAKVEKGWVAAPPSSESGAQSSGAGGVSGAAASGAMSAALAPPVQVPAGFAHDVTAWGGASAPQRRPEDESPLILGATPGVLGRSAGDAPSLPAGASAAPEGAALPVGAPDDGGSRPAPDPALPPVLQIPTADALAGCLTDLIGQEVKLKKVPAKPKSLEGAPGLYAAALLDDSGRELGAIIADAATTITLGGTLLMLPEAGIKDQLRTKKPTEDSIEAMSEVFNMLTAPFNNIDDNAHVRVSPCSTLAELELRWLDGARVRADFECSVGGKLMVLAR